MTALRILAVAWTLGCIATLACIATACWVDWQQRRADVRRARRTQLPWSIDAELDAILTDAERGPG